MAEAGRGWPLRLLRGSDKQSGALGVPALCDRSLATNASAAQPERWVHMETHDEVVKSPAALQQYRSGRNDLGGEQTWRPEHQGISASSKHGPARSRNSW